MRTDESVATRHKRRHAGDPNFVGLFELAKDLRSVAALLEGLLELGTIQA